MKSFANKVAIVTGGASGIGKSISEHLALCGAEVVVVDRNSEAAQKVQAAILSTDAGPKR